MSLPVAAARIDPAKYLPQPFREEYVRSVELSLDPWAWEPIPKAYHNITRENEIQLAKDLCSRGLAKFMREGALLAMLYRDPAALRAAAARTDDLLLSGGWFGVPHKDESDRLILDKRPANATLQTDALHEHGARRAECFADRSHKPK